MVCEIKHIFRVESFVDCHVVVVSAIINVFAAESNRHHFHTKKDENGIDLLQLVACPPLTMSKLSFVPLHTFIKAAQT